MKYFAFFVFLFYIKYSALGYVFKNSCSKQESWEEWPAIKKELGENGLDLLRDIIANPSQEATLKNMAIAFSLIKNTENDNSTTFVEYMIARGFYSLKLYYPAQQMFLSILKKKHISESQIFSFSALECLNQIKNENTSFSYSLNEEEAIKSMASAKSFSDRYRNVLAESYYHLLLMNTAVNGATQDQKILYYRDALINSNYEDSAFAITGLFRGNEEVTIKYLEPYGNNQKPFPAPFQSHPEQIHFMLARAYFEKGMYPKAIQQFEKIKNNQPLFIKSLEGIILSKMNLKSYKSVIGMSFSANSMWVKKTFLPLGLLAPAIALSELCQFATSLKVIKSFFTSYKPYYQYLKKISPNKSYYDALMQTLKEKSEAIPPAIALELAQSEKFKSLQGGIDELNKELKFFLKISNDHKDIKKNWKEKIQKTASSIKLDLANAISKKETKEKKEIVEYVKEFKEKQENLKKEMLHWHHFDALKYLLKDVYTKFKKNKKETTESYIKSINQEFYLILVDLMQQMQEVKENADLVVAEIYNGAGEDLASRQTQQTKNPTQNDGKSKVKQKSIETIYDWGTKEFKIDSNEEIWADELSSLSSSLEDNCNNAQKYMNLPSRN